MKVSMHDIVMNELEKHFTGDAPQAFYDHLAVCARCRDAVAEMDSVSLFFEDLKPAPTSPVPEPRLGFYNRVAATIVETQRREAWGLSSPGAAFFRRIAFAALLLVAGLSTFLVTRETADGGPDAAAIMAQHDVSSEQILATLASYNPE